MEEGTSMKTLKIILILMLILITTGCGQKNEEGENEIPKITVLEERETSDSSKVDIQDNGTEKNKIEETSRPSKEEVLSKRAQVLDGMSEEEVNRMNQVIKDINVKMEQEIIWGNRLASLSDPQDLYWNLLSNTGEVQVGWAYEQDALDLKKSTELSEDDFNEQYGIAVMEYNEYTSEDFISCMQELRDSTNYEDFKKDFNQLIDNMEKAEETHNVGYIENIYKIIHDMDYFLLRYGPEDVGKYTEDSSTVAKYYGVLNVY